jgi:hypothetical protein
VHDACDLQPVGGTFGRRLAALTRWWGCRLLPNYNSVSTEVLAAAEPRQATPYIRKLRVYTIPSRLSTLVAGSSSCLRCGGA